MLKKVGNRVTGYFQVDLEKCNAKKDVRRILKEIAKISPEHGNAVMDILGTEEYLKCMASDKEA